jgi:triacylglycerol lipase
VLTTRTYPIALACGFSRFDELLPWRRFDRAGNDAFHYFKKIRGTVIAAGYPAFHTHVSWGAPLEKRGHDLAHEVDSILAITGAPRLHIIAHSMGGLDARYVINVLGYAAKVCSLTTIATPHHGSPLADWITDENTWRGRTLRQLQRIAVAVGLDLRGFRDLTLTACAARNAEWAASEARCGVHFRTWAGVCPFWPTFLPLKLGHLLLRYQHGLGANDGLVPLESAVWQRKFFQGAVPFDHFNEVGWWTPDRVFGGDFVALTFERRVREFYVALARELQDLQ